MYGQVTGARDVEMAIATKLTASEHLCENSNVLQLEAMHGCNNIKYILDTWPIYVNLQSSNFGPE